MPSPRIPGRRGFTLTELILVIVLMGLIAAMGFPRMTRWVQTVSQRSAANQLVADLGYARSLAAREGSTVSLRILDPTTYAVTLDRPDGTVERQVRRVDLSTLNRTTAFTVESGRIAFDSRGILRPSPATTTDSVRLVRGAVAHTVRITQVGRPYRAQ